MNTDKMLKETMEEWSAEAQVPDDLAGRALGPRRTRRVGLLLASAVVAAAVAVAAVMVVGQEPTPTEPTVVISLNRPTTVPTDVHADTENTPPKKFIAAGRMAVSAYFTWTIEPIEGELRQMRRSWRLYDSATGEYRMTPWSWVDAAPGLRLAAFLDGELPSKELGIFDMTTGKELTRITLEQPAGAVKWSPDGTRLLVTTYRQHPDRFSVQKNPGDPEEFFSHQPSTRTGYYLVDVATMRAEFHDLPALGDSFDNSRPGNSNGRQDFGWSLDGALIWGPTNTIPDRYFYDLNGKEVDAPTGQRYVDYTGYPATSPDGRLVIARRSGLPTSVENVDTKEIAGRQKVLQLHSWADDDNLVALGCAGVCDDEFRNGLVLVSVDGKRSTQLSPDVDSDGPDAWRWVLTPR